MKLSELIKELNVIYSEHGDIEVLFDGCMENFAINYQEDVNTVHLW